MQQAATRQYTRDEPARTPGTGRCSICRLLPHCMGEQVAGDTGRMLDGLVRAGGMVGTGHVLFRQGDPLDSLFTVRSGYFKSSVYRPDGTEQVLGFHLPGDILGLDAIHEGHHRCTVTALCRASACAYSYTSLAEIAAGDPALQQRLLVIMSREIGAYMQRMGDACADARIAGFLLEMSRRFAERGYSPRFVQLMMPRRDIGNYLRLATETVSRVLTRLQQDGLIRVNRREVELLDLDALEALAC